MLSPHTGAHPMIRIQIVSTVAFSFLVLGCDASSSTTHWTGTFDTLPSGAVHVVNSPPIPNPGPGFELQEELRIGSVDGPGPTSFGQLKGIAVTRDGNIVVLDALAQELRVFGSDGVHMATFGGKGGGPGEFESAYGLMLSPAGMLWVPDHRSARMSVFDPSDGFRESYPLRILSRGFVWGGIMDTEGRVLKPSITLGPPRRPVLRIYGSNMSLLDSLPLPDRPDVDRKNPPGAFFWEAPDGRASGYISVPFYPQGQQLLDPQGFFWSTAAGDPSYRIIHWAPGEDTSLVIETRRPPVPVPSSVRDSALAEVREFLRERGAANQDWAKVPEVLPAISSLFLADNGDLWVEVASTDTLTKYDVYEHTGKYWGTVSTSLDILPWVRPVVHGDQLWAVVTDDLDVPYVVRARIHSTRSETE